MTARATVTQAQIRRVIRAAKAEGAAEVEVKVGAEASVLIRMVPSTAPETPAGDGSEIVL